MKRLSDSEWRLMLALWRSERLPMSIEEIGASLDLDYRATRSAAGLLVRCAQKGYLEAALATRPVARGETVDRRQVRVFTPKVSLAHALAAEIDHFAELRLGGHPDLIEQAVEALEERIR